MATTPSLINLHTLSINTLFKSDFTTPQSNQRHHHRQLIVTAKNPGPTASTPGPTNPLNLNNSVDKFRQIAASSLSPPPLDKFRQIAASSLSPPPAYKFLHQIVASFPPVVLLIKRQSGANTIVGFSIATVCLIIAVRSYVARRLRDERPGSVADLVRRGQLRSDRRGISKPLKYEDPFNNPLVKVGNGNSTVEMCGKVYRLAPVTLTDEQRTVHQKRRSRAYEWKRPKVFLKEGDSIPPDVDPETVRWIPANHPFATTVNDIDEDLAQSNIYQKHGVPFRIQAEHEALQKKLEALQSDKKLNKLVIDPANAIDFERAYKAQSKSFERAENGPHNGQVSDSKTPKSDQGTGTVDRNAAAEDTDD